MRRSTLVGVHGRREERERQHDDDDAQRRAAAPYASASSVMSICPNGGISPKRTITVRPSRTTSALMIAISSASGSENARHARDLRPDAGERRGGQRRAATPAEQQRVLEGQRAA